MIKSWEQDISQKSYTNRKYALEKLFSIINFMSHLQIRPIPSRMAEKKRKPTRPSIGKHKADLELTDALVPT